MSVGDQLGLRVLLEQLPKIFLGIDEPGVLGGLARLHDATGDELGKLLAGITVDNAGGLDGVDIAGTEDDAGRRFCDEISERVDRAAVDGLLVIRGELVGSHGLVHHANMLKGKRELPFAFGG